MYKPIFLGLMPSVALSKQVQCYLVHKSFRQ